MSILSQRKFFFWILLGTAIGCFPARFVFAETETQPAAQKSTEPEPQVTEKVEDSVKPRLKEIKRLKKRGKYLEAQKVYEALLSDTTLKHDQKKEIQSAYENFNIKLLFSRFEMEESQYHEVALNESLYEIAKKYHTTVALIKKSNGLGSDTIRPGMKLKVITKTFSIQIDKSKNQLVLMLDDKVLKHYSVATGKEDTTPSGQFDITNKLENPTWYKAGAVLPPGSPENALGSRWLGFDYPGYGIHGTTDPKTIGKQASSGCIRMLNQDVEELYIIVPIGTKVTITD